MNLACEKHTWQTSEKYPSSKAVDGLCGNLSESGGQCAVSLESNADVTWLVDLGTIQSIHKIVIHYRTDDMPFGEWIKNYSKIVDKSNK